VFLIVIALLYALWWGGFTFYAGFVVPQGMKILGDHFKMGLITQSVTNYLNAIGVSALFVSLLFMMFFNRQAGNIFRIIGWDWFVLALLQALLFYVHHLLSISIQLISPDVPLERFFYNTHRIYLLASTVIWLIIPFHAYRVKEVGDS
jgi:hypothetical protein